MPNGLTVLQYPRPSSMTAQLSIAIKYGSNDDSEEQSGKAHFLEHMLVGGSRKRIRIHSEIEKSGGMSDFETSNEHTFCIMDVFPEKIAEASKILSSLLFETKFEKEKLELERKVILNEIDDSFDDPEDTVDKMLLNSLFETHPVKNPILGSRKSVEQLSLDKIEQTHRARYSPQNMILILTGNFSDKDVNLVLEDFQNRENENAISKNTSQIETGEPTKRCAMARHDLKQANLSFGLRTTTAQDSETPILDLIVALLGLGESSRLFVELREKRALTYHPQVSNTSGLDFGFLSVSCSVKSKSLNQTQNIIEQELEKIKKREITKGELDKIKNLMIGNIYRLYDNTFEFPRNLAYMEIQFNAENAQINYINKIRSVTQRDIIKVANKYFRKNNYATAIITPKE